MIVGCTLLCALPEPVAAVVPEIFMFVVPAPPSVAVIPDTEPLPVLKLGPLKEP